MICFSRRCFSRWIRFRIRSFSRRFSRFSSSARRASSESIEGGESCPERLPLKEAEEEEGVGSKNEADVDAGNRGEMAYGCGRGERRLLLEGRGDRGESSRGEPMSEQVADSSVSTESSPKQEAVGLMIRNVSKDGRGLMRFVTSSLLTVVLRESFHHELIREHGSQSQPYRPLPLHQHVKFAAYNQSKSIEACAANQLTLGQGACAR